MREYEYTYGIEFVDFGFILVQGEKAKTGSHWFDISSKGASARRLCAVLLPL